MNEEAGFVAALLAEPDDRTALLVYADWLQERADPRAEYLRLLAADRLGPLRGSRLRRSLDAAWVHLIDTRHFRAGARARVLHGSFLGSEGIISAVTADRQAATVVITFWGRPIDIESPLTELELVPAET